MTYTLRSLYFVVSFIPLCEFLLNVKKFPPHTYNEKTPPKESSCLTTEGHKSKLFQATEVSIDVKEKEVSRWVRMVTSVVDCLQGTTVFSVKTKKVFFFFFSYLYMCMYIPEKGGMWTGEGVSDYQTLVIGDIGIILRSF